MIEQTAPRHIVVTHDDALMIAWALNEQAGRRRDQAAADAVTTMRAHRAGVDGRARALKILTALEQAEVMQDLASHVADSTGDAGEQP